MARTLVATYQAKPSATSVSFSAGDVANGMKVAPGGRLFLFTYNGDVVARTLTLLLPPPPDIADATDIVVSTSAGGSKIIGPFPGDGYTQPSAASPLDVGFVHFNVESTLLTVLAVRL